MPDDNGDYLNPASAAYDRTQDEYLSGQPDRPPPCLVGAHSPEDADRELKAKVARLPAWAREYIARLERAVNENLPNLRAANQKAAALQKRLDEVKARLEAVEQLVTCAARGGHETAQAYVDRVMAEYGPEKDDGDE